MSDQTVSAEVARVQAPAQLIQASLTEFARVLPAGAGISREMFGQWALNMLSKALADPKQAQAWERVLDPGNGAGLTSVMVALKQCAELGLRPGSEYHLVPFGSTVTGVTDYHGEIRLITNHEPCVVIPKLVRANDKFAMLAANLPPKHEVNPFLFSRGAIIGGYCYVEYPDGRQSLVVYMPRSSDDPDANTFDKHQQIAKTQAIWQAWYEAMCLKTLVHAIRDFVPWSAERKW